MDAREELLELGACGLNTLTSKNASCRLSPQKHCALTSARASSSEFAEAKYEGAGEASSADHVAALSNAQRNATHRMPRNTVVESFLYSLSFVS